MAICLWALHPPRDVGEGARLIHGQQPAQIDPGVLTRVAGLRAEAGPISLPHRPPPLSHPANGRCSQPPALGRLNPCRCPRLPCLHIRLRLLALNLPCVASPLARPRALLSPNVTLSK